MDVFLQAVVVIGRRSYRRTIWQHWIRYLRRRWPNDP